MEISNALFLKLKSKAQTYCLGGGSKKKSNVALLKRGSLNLEHSKRIPYSRAYP
jgi:hypothetical protein